MVAQMEITSSRDLEDCELDLEMFNSRIEAQAFAFMVHHLRLRWLAYYLLGPSAIIVWINCDQKPLWFTSARDLKSLHHLGTKGVYVRENVPMTRERFTAMTRTMWPQLLDDGKDLAVMFRADGEDHSTIRSRLKVPPRTLLQFAPKGSYQLQHTLEYYRWILPADDDELSKYPKGPNQDKAVFCCLLDWYAPNLDPEVDDVIEDRNGMVLRLPGCVTGHVQVNDTGCHGPYSTNYKKDEVADNLAQLRAGVSMPSVSRQTVLDRAANAWQKVDHERVSQHFVGVGFANNLDGTEDKTLNENVQEIWFDLEMPSWRERLRRQIEGEVQAKRLTSMSQYKQVLIPYEDHMPAEEGQEACTWRAGDVEKDAAIDTDDDAAAADEEDQEEGAAIVASGDAEADHGSIVAELDDIANEKYEEAITNLQKLLGTK